MEEVDLSELRSVDKSHKEKSHTTKNSESVPPVAGGKSKMECLPLKASGAE